ncbi:LysR family transcriptional regulator [Rhodosalinus halophilus]|uniref:LysR family transcriptional regulator n=1 Tax=Rhodosalinus halophilus TaxID=2259333 RepID=A0A365U9L0_9RHOB|nr:LysR family transcriptional regulator [Rhodosalinus halophilus]RBI85546.1 LysR family transcriptional regulator [Rhodosalinus halophilus]
MDDRPDTLHWSLLRAFLAVAETGSLSAAARALGTSQPTLGRHIRALEQQLGAELFTRQARGLALTATGQELMAPAQRMREAAAEIARTGAAQAGRLEGTVRVTASRVVSHYLLPPVLADLRRAEPAIQVELVPSDESENLLYREADLAVRMYRPTQLDLVARHLGDLEIGIFAARSYLDGQQRPRTLDDLLTLDLVGYDRNPLIVEAMRAMGYPAARDWFALRCDDQAAYWALVRAGGGVGFMPRAVGTADPEVEELLPGAGLPRLPMWLAAPEAMRRSPRIARVWEGLVTGLARAMAAA